MNKAMEVSTECASAPLPPGEGGITFGVPLETFKRKVALRERGDAAAKPAAPWRARSSPRANGQARSAAAAAAAAALPPPLTLRRRPRAPRRAGHHPGGLPRRGPAGLRQHRRERGRARVAHRVRGAGQVAEPAAGLELHGRPPRERGPLLAVLLHPGPGGGVRPEGGLGVRGGGAQPAPQGPAEALCRLRGQLHRCAAGRGGPCAPAERRVGSQGGSRTCRPGVGTALRREVGRTR
jgi:hypothetical protein